MNYHSAVMTRFLLGRRMTVVKNGDSHFVTFEHLDGNDGCYFIFPEEYTQWCNEMVLGDGFEFKSYETRTA